jgi:predicted permease
MSTIADRVTQDLRYAVRGLSQARGPALLAIVLLALGIGLNGAIAMVLDRLLFRTPPGVADVDGLRRVHQHHNDPRTGEAWTRSGYSYVELQAMRRSIGGEGSLSAHVPMRMNVAGEPTTAGVTGVVGDYFGVLRVQPIIGRFFSPDEVERDGAAHIVVISERAWGLLFNRDPSAIGRTVTIGAEPQQRYVVIGVAPPRFRGVAVEEADYWIPFNATEPRELIGNWFRTAIDARGTVLLRARDSKRLPALASAIAAGIDRLNPLIGTGPRLELAPLAETLEPHRGKSALSVLWRLAGAGAVVFAIACSNVGSLLLIRMSRRRREIAIRYALGASRARLAGQMLAEGVLLALAAGIPALLTAWWGFSALTNLLLPELAMDERAMMIRGLAVVAALMCVGGFAVGLMPALYFRDPNLANALKGGGDATPHASRFRGSLLVVQTMLSIVLLAGTGMFVRSLIAVENLGFGYRASRVVLASLPHAIRDQDRADRAHLVDAAAARIAAVPSVKRVATTSAPPVNGVAYTFIFAPGKTAPEGRGDMHVVASISPTFLSVMGVPLVRGRGVTAADRADTEPVILVNAATAARYWPGEDAVGKCLTIERRTSPCRRVVGVVADVRVFELFEKPVTRVYLPSSQFAPAMVTPHIAIDVGGADLDDEAARIRGLLDGDAGGGLKWSVATFASMTERQFRPWRLSALLVGLLGVIAVVVTGIGAYAVTAYSVSQRLHELSVRRVLGAETSQLVWLVMGSLLRVVAIGAGIGTTIVLAIAPLVRSSLYGVSAQDPFSLAGAIGLQLAIAALACIVPTLAAARVEPRDALANQ